MTMNVNLTPELVKFVHDKPNFHRRPLKFLCSFVISPRRI